MRFTASHLRRLAVDENFFDDEAHSAEAVGVAVLPDRVVVDFVNSVDEADLKVKSALRNENFQCLQRAHQVRDRGFRVRAAHFLKKAVVGDKQERTASLCWRVLVLIGLTLGAALAVVLWITRAVSLRLWFFVVLVRFKLQALLYVAALAWLEVLAVVVVLPAQLDVRRFVSNHLLVGGFRDVSPRRLDVVSLVWQDNRCRQHVPIVDVGGYVRAYLAKNSPPEEAIGVNVDDRLVSIGVDSIGLEVLMQNFSVRVKDQLELSAVRLELHLPDLVVQVYAGLGASLHNGMS